MKYTQLLSLFLVMHVINTNAMDRLLTKRYEVKQRSHRSNKIVLVSRKENQIKKIVPHEKDLVCYLHQGTFYPTFPKEIDKDILGLVITNTGQTLQEASQIFSALICVNKFTYMHMDDDQRTLGWIKDLSKRFDCTNLDVAKALRTKVGKNRYVLQAGLDLEYWNNNEHYVKHISELKQRGFDVNFSYYKNLPSPLLQCCTDVANNEYIIPWLLGNGADMSICTPEGKKAQDIVKEAKYKGSSVEKIINLLEQAAIRFDSQENSDQSK